MAKKPNLWLAPALLGLLICLGAQLAARAQGTSTAATVRGKANPWLAGMPPGTQLQSDAAPDNSPELIVSSTLGGWDGAVLTFSATGSVNYRPTPPPSDPPDGKASFIANFAGPYGMSALTAPIDSLVGVFLDNNPPNQGDPQGVNFDFSTPGSRDFQTLAPQLKQVFFIGDGKTSQGVVQHFLPPAGSTQLWLGVMDGAGWHNNTGSFNVQIFKLPPPPPVTILDVDKQLTSVNQQPPTSKTIANPGDTLTYVLSYANEPNGLPVNNPKVTDPLPRGTAFVSAFFLDQDGTQTSSPIPGPNGHNPEFSGGNVIWYLGTNGQAALPSGTSGKLQLTVKVLDAGSLTGQTAVENRDYRINGTDANGPLSGGGQTVSVPLNSVQIQAKADPGSVTPGQPVTFTLTVTNNTSAPIKNLTITDVVPDGTYFLASNPLKMPDSQADPLHGKVTWTLKDLKLKQLAVHQSASVTILVATAFDAGQTTPAINNDDYAVTYNGITAHGSPLQVPVSGDPVDAPELGLRILTSTPADDGSNSEATVVAGDTITYTIVCFNLGSSPAVGCILYEEIPQGVTVTPVSKNAVPVKDPINGNVIYYDWHVGDEGTLPVSQIGVLSPGAHALVQFKATVPKGTATGTLIRNGAFALSSESYNALTMGVPIPKTVKVVPAVTLNAVVASNPPSLYVQNGATPHAVYTLTCTNTGKKTATGVTLTDTLTAPPGTSIVSASSGGQVNGLTVTWSNLTVAPRTLLQVQVEVATTATSGTVVNTPSVTPSTPGGVVTGTATPILQGARLFVTIETFLQIDQGGDQELDYTIHYGNTGDQTATGVVITDPIPAGTQFLSAPPNASLGNPNGGEIDGNQVVWHLDDLPAHSASAVKLRVQVTADTGGFFGLGKGGAADICNCDCHVSSNNVAGQAAGGPGALDAAPVVYSGTVNTHVRPQNALFAVFDAIGAFFKAIGDDFSGFVDVLLHGKPQLKQDLQTLNRNSRVTAAGGLAPLFRKDGVTIYPLFGNQVMVTMPAILSHDGGTVISNDGGSLTLVGNAEQIRILSHDGGTLVTVASELTPQAIAAIVAAGAGNLIGGDVAGLIGAGGSTLISNVDGSNAGPIPPSNPNTGAQILTNNGGTIVAAGAGNIVTENGGGIIATGGGNLLSERGGG